MQTNIQHHARHLEDTGLDTLALALGIAGFVPPFLILGSIGAIVCGCLARGSSRARVGIALGIVGLLAPLVALFVYCVVLGYPFPIHRYHAAS